MIIESKNWTAQIDRMPSTEGGTFRIHGTVVVAHPGIVPVLSMSKIQDKSLALNIDLNLETQDGSFLQVVTEKEVVFELKVGYDNVPYATVFHDGQILVRIMDIKTTH
ncbi:MAG TPA: hypothetical protein VJS90_18740 [Pseudomonas sp.]|uniref:hypothetical protein n=1 Tax=Pseudomonas sp. TaxID=306 RepID=UPI002B4A6FD2|nr:hypothetical protein [Pseudomonas sp.]HKS15073.1 hypothetical protein [Pseudomonas sp.]